MANPQDILRRTARKLAPMVLVSLGIFACIELFAWLTYGLASAGKVELASLEQITPPVRHPTEAAALHSIGEWPADRIVNMKGVGDWAW